MSVTDDGAGLTNASESLLRMSGIVKQFSSVRALDGIDLEVTAGEVHCLLGQNGAGKSTLIKILSASYQPDEGTIWWKGAEVRFGPPAGRDRCGCRHDLPGFPVWSSSTPPS